MADRASIKIIKQFTYRGSMRLFSNRYHFTGDAIPSLAAFGDFADQVIEGEKHIYPDVVTIVKADYSDPGSDLTKYSVDRAVVGTASTSAGSIAPGDAASLLRYSTDARSTKNHPVYLFNYYHSPLVAPAGDPDELVGSYKAALEAYANEWIVGNFTSAGERFRCGPRGAVALSYFAEPNVTHRDLPRRS